MRIRIIIPIIFVFLLSGCASTLTGPLYNEVSAPNDGRSHLYIYRPDVFTNSVIAPAIVLNNKELFLLENGGYTILNINPGTHKLSIKLSENYKGNSELKVKAKKNKKIFVKLVTYNKQIDSSKFKRIFRLDQVNESMAKNEIKECRLINPEKSEKFEKSIFWYDN